METKHAHNHNNVHNQHSKIDELIPSYLLKDDNDSANFDYIDEHNGGVYEDNDFRRILHEFHDLNVANNSPNSFKNQEDEKEIHEKEMKAPKTRYSDNMILQSHHCLDENIRGMNNQLFGMDNFNNTNSINEQHQQQQVFAQLTPPVHKIDTGLSGFNVNCNNMMNMNVNNSPIFMNNNVNVTNIQPIINHQHSPQTFHHSPHQNQLLHNKQPQIHSHLYQHQSPIPHQPQQTHLIQSPNMQFYQHHHNTDTNLHLTSNNTIYNLHTISNLPQQPQPQTVLNTWNYPQLQYLNNNDLLSQSNNLQLQTHTYNIQQQTLYQQQPPLQNFMGYSQTPPHHINNFNSLEPSYHLKKHNSFNQINHQQFLNRNHSSSNSFSHTKKVHSQKHKHSSLSANNSIISTNSDGKANLKKKKKKKGSLFNNDPNKPEDDLRDYQIFLNSLKCDLPEYICDQIGSRIMQKFLGRFNSEIITLLIMKLGSSFNKIMVDLYGNYFCKELLKSCSQEQRLLILGKIKTHFIQISKHQSGTHVIQTLLEQINSQTEELLILSFLELHEIELAYDDNGTHVLQKILDVINESNREKLNSVLFTEKNIHDLSLDPKGICVIKKMIKTSSNATNRAIIIATTLKYCKEIAESPYGNYAIQYLFEEWGIKSCIQIANFCINHTLEFSIQKFSSNIIDKLLNICERDKLFEQLNQIRNSLFNLNHIKGVYNNKYGKFILIKVANFMSEAEREELKVSLIEKERESTLKEQKRIDIIIDILNKCDGNYINSNGNTK